jgi:hypothetical protein
MVRKKQKSESKGFISGAQALDMPHLKALPGESFGHSPSLLLMSINVQTVTELLKKISPSTWITGFLVLLIYQALDALINNFLEVLFKSPEGTPNWVWFVAGFSVLINILFPVGISFWLLSAVKSTRNWSGDFQQLLIETLRVWGKILTFTLAFLIPGLWKWVSTIFVPYVVLFSKKYRAGDADAILSSQMIFKKVWARSMVVLVVFSILVPLFMTTSFDEYREIWVHPFGALFIGAVEYLSLTLSLFLLLAFFVKASQEVQNELVF